MGPELLVAAVSDNRLWHDLGQSLIEMALAALAAKAPSRERKLTASGR